MKKLKSIICLMLVCVLCLLSTETAFAAGTLYKSDGTVQTKITPAIAKTGTAQEFNSTPVYGVEVTNDEEKSHAVPISISKAGVLDFDISSLNDDCTGTAKFGIYSDAALTKSVVTASINLDSKYVVSKRATLKKGTYYLSIQVESTDQVESFLFGFQGLLYQSDAQTMKNNTWTVAGKASGAVYHKLTVTKPSSLVISGDILAVGSSLKVTLCNSSKKAVSKALSVQSFPKELAVKKGVYYIKVTTDSPIYYLKPVVKTVNDQAGTTKAKSKAIKVNGTSKGVVGASDKKGKTNYYKITTTKAGQLKGLYVGYTGQGQAKVSIKVPGLAAKTFTVSAGQFMNYTYTETKTSANGPTYYRDGYFPKGTYYITVTKPDNSSSGTYTIGAKKYQ